MTNGFAVEIKEIKSLDKTLVNNDSNLRALTNPFENIFSQIIPSRESYLGLNLTERFNTIEFEFVVRSALHYYWDKFKTLSFHGNFVDEICNDLERFFDNDEVELEVMAPLKYLNSEEGFVDIEFGDIKLRRITEIELEKYFNTEHDLRMSLYCLSKIVITKKIYEFPKTDAEECLELREICSCFKRVLDSLRIYQEGIVGFDEVYFFSKRFIPQHLTSKEWYGENIGRGYFIKPSEINAIKEFHAKITNVNNDSLRVACERLAMSQNDKNPLSSFVDVMTGLESLFIAEHNQELSFRFALSYASLFDDPVQRLDKYGLAKTLYVVRSRLVHGLNLKDKIEGKTLQEWLNIGRNVLREVVKEYLSKETPPFDTNTNYWVRRILSIPKTDDRHDSV